VLKRLHRRLLVDDSGFTMVTVMLTMAILGLFAVGAWGAARDDIRIGRGDQDRKRAYEAAQAGVEWYSYQLARDPSYWEKCAAVPALSSGNPAPVSLEGTPGPTWSTVVGADGTSASQEQFRVEILDKRNSSGARIASCSTADPAGTALQDGTLRVRATGRANGRYRSIIGTFRRIGFVDYIYFTQWETQDPIISGVSGCDKKRSQRAGGCVTIQFQNADKINGPMHTNDESVVTCGSPTFGRVGKSDRWEVSGPAPGFIQACGSYTPTFNGPRILPAGTLTLPDGNTELAALAGPDWTFTGQTCLDFKSDNTVDVYEHQSWGTTKQVTCNTSNGGTKTNKPLTGSGGPPNGVIYVQGNGGSCTYAKAEDYSNSSTCGDVAVQGTYGTSLTIGAGNDVVVNGDLKHAGDTMMGLIASNFVRIYHPFANRTSSSCGTAIGYTPVTQVDAAVLALAHSFVVDNYDCGSPVGSLTVNGAIAQYYRGTVGTGSGTTISTGYAKNYVYDDRLKFRSPPNFLDPIETRWEIVRKSEQAPANTTP
jgi:type II secretory pathway pseudopilin PulG